MTGSIGVAAAVRTAESTNPVRLFIATTNLQPGRFPLPCEESLKRVAKYAKNAVTPWTTGNEASSSISPRQQSGIAHANCARGAAFAPELRFSRPKVTNVLGADADADEAPEMTAGNMPAKMTYVGRLVADCSIVVQKALGCRQRAAPRDHPSFKPRETRSPNVGCECAEMRSPAPPLPATTRVV